MPGLKAEEEVLRWQKCQCIQLPLVQIPVNTGQPPCEQNLLTKRYAKCPSLHHYCSAHRYAAHKRTAASDRAGHGLPSAMRFGGCCLGDMVIAKSFFEFERFVSRIYSQN